MQADLRELTSTNKATVRLDDLERDIEGRIGGLVMQGDRVREVWDEFRFEVFEERGVGGQGADEVTGHQDLAVGVRAGADADEGDLDEFLEVSDQFHRHGFDDDCQTAGVLEVECVGDDIAGFSGTVVALDFEAAETAGALRGEADVADDGHPEARQTLDQRLQLLPSLDLEPIHPGRLDQPRGSPDALLDPGLEGSEGEIGNEERDPMVRLCLETVQPTADRFQMVDELLNPKLRRGLVTETDIRQGITTKTHVDPIRNIAARRLTLPGM